MKILKTISKIIVLTIVTIGIYELIGQHLVFPHLVDFVDDIDHRMRPNSNFDINADGIRSMKDSEEFQDQDTNVLILGDSFIYGAGLPYEKSIPYLFENKLQSLNPNININVANFGWISSSPLLSYRLLQDIGKSYNPDIVILAIDMTDIYEDINYLYLMEKRGIYYLNDIIPVTILSFKKLISFNDFLHKLIFGFPGQRFFATHMPLSDSISYFSFIKDNIDKIYNYSKDQLDANFIVTILPRSFQYSENECPENWEKSEYQILGPYVYEPFKYFERLKTQGIEYPIYSLLSDFQNTSVFPTCHNEDPHWNEAGNKVAVEALYKYVQKDIF